MDGEVPRQPDLGRGRSRRPRDTDNSARVEHAASPPQGGVDRSWTVHGAIEDRVWIDGERSSDEGREAIR